MMSYEMHSKPSSLETLPSEILLLTARFINIDGGVHILRLISSQIQTLVDQNPRILLREFCDYHGIDARLLNLFFDQQQERAIHSSSTDKSLLRLLTLSTEYRFTQFLSTGLQPLRLLPTVSSPNVLASETAKPFLLFSALSKALRSSLDKPVLITDVLAPSSRFDDAIPIQLSPDFNRLLYHDLTLHELESIIIAINSCATRLWSSLFVYKSSLTKINTFACLSGHSFNIEQAIMTEHIIWRGPRWVAQILQSQDGTTSAATSQHKVSMSDLLNSEWPWRGAQDTGARLVANGIARVLWKERQRKLEEKIDFNSMTEMGVSPVIWRGSAGDI